MAYTFDFALLFIATCSAFYCWTLSRRLQALQNLRKGVGQAMVNLTKSVTAVESNAVKLNREAMAAVSELRIMLSKVDSSEEKVDLLLQTMDQQARETWRDYKIKTSEATETLDKAYKALETSLAEANELVKRVEAKSAEIKSLEAKPDAVEPSPVAEPAKPPVKKPTAAPRAERARTKITAERDMSAREIALARALAAQRAKEKAEAAELEDDLAAYTATPRKPAAELPKDDAVASFARRLRQKQARSSLKQNPFQSQDAKRANS